MLKRITAALLTGIDAYSQFARYVFAGTINTLASYAIYFLLITWLPYPLAYGIAYICGLVIQYFMVSRFVFYVHMSLTTTMGYLFLHLVQYGLGVLLLYLFIDLLAFSIWLGSALAIGVIVPVSFILSRLWLMRDKRN